MNSAVWKERISIMDKGILSLFQYIDDPQILIQYVRDSGFDELLVLDIPNDRMKAVFHMEEKYQMPVLKGGYTEFYKYAADHMVFPEDKDEYVKTMDPGRIMSVLSDARIPGAMEFRFQTRGMDRQWRWVNQLMITGERYGIDDGIVECYIYDIQQIVDRELGLNTADENLDVKPDPMTGLYRKKDFFNLAESILSGITGVWYLISIDLEKFKLFNEWYGWENGNMVLARIGAGLRMNAVNLGGLACYMGDDDFCLFVPAEKCDVDLLYKNIRGVLQHYGASVGFLPSFGIAEVSESISIMELYDRASFACELARNDLKNRIRFYDRKMVEQIETDYSLITDFQRALKENEITFFLQPQCHASTGKIVGAEALVRWKKKDGSYVPPALFVPVLEKYNFITDLDQFMWERVAIWIRSWLDRGNPLLPISVNVSRVDIFTIDVPSFFHNLMEKYKLSWNAIKIEITESAVAEDSSTVRNVVKQLREKGFLVLMDDFGSGYSSLNMLHEFEVDVIKIDANFLRMERNTEVRGVNILESVINMTKMMGIPIIVEGVETKEQREFLLSLGCRYMQGFFFFRPMSVANFEKLTSDSANIESEGFVFKANEQFRVREFMDNSIYSDAMLNNILGPAAIYAWGPQGVDIIRFNEQFYEAVHSPVFHERLQNIGQFMPPDEVPLLENALKRAMVDRLNGSSELLSFYQTGGGASRFLIQFYYLGSEGENRRFYGSARDVTQITLLQKHMDLVTRVFSECIIFAYEEEDGFDFEVVAQGLPELGMTREELEKELADGSVYARVAPEYREMLRQQCQEAFYGIDFSSFFTLINKEGRRVNLHIQSDYIEDEASDVRCVVTISNRTRGE